MAHRYSIGFDITDEQGKNIIYYNPSNDYDSDYDPTDDDNRDYDPAPGITNYDNSVATYDLNNDDDAIIINPAVADHHGPVSLVTANHYHNLTDNPNHKTSAEDADTSINKPAPAGVVLKEGHEATNNNPNNYGNDGPDYFIVQKYPEHKGCQLQRQKNDDKDLLRIHLSMKEHCPMAEVVMNQYNMRRGLKK